ncbi:hypothetical protein HL658_13430 [Azospirillum sp. RWY-5-1]|uniref:Uncharacterized protein n=1 Tax=Azospirillum oleiclasticum TaxID=2735135 RepID=A0ABX2T8R0_9PROT|nr:hypothetical protein [Azospirillum oleiclasticum]NYZ13554.1 hypothetical protein [Azospirillum oleiclasticum]NYZ20714.1 hypothetical protein [Azospirillum oleiclasticum]
MTDSDDLRVLQDFLRANGLPATAWRSVRCTFTPTHIDHKAADDKVTGFAGPSGWVSRTDRNALYRDGGWTPEQGTSPILAAELLMADGRSVSLRHLDGDRWLCVEAVEHAGGDAFLARDVEYLSVLKDLRLRYTVYWRQDGDRYRPVASRFTGFVATTGKE